MPEADQRVASLELIGERTDQGDDARAAEHAHAADAVPAGKIGPILCAILVFKAFPIYLGRG